MEELKILYANGLTLSVANGEARLLFTVSTPIIDENGVTTDVRIDDVADIRVSSVVLQQINQTVNDGISKFQTLEKSEDNNG